jgi:hypothetical protein
MKYTLNTYGWSFEVICKSLTDKQVQIIKDKMDKEGFSELHEIRFELDELLDLDFWDGEILHKTEAFDNSTMYFEIIDEVGNTLMGFTMNEVGDLYETIEDYDDKYEYRGYELIPQSNIPPTNLYLSIDENKGGIFKFEFETDTAPLPSDFTYSTGSIDTPDGDYDFVDKIFFKGQPLEIKDNLDNSGKASTVKIYTLGGETIE